MRQIARFRLSLIYLFADYCFAAPISTTGQPHAIAQSSDVWAQVVANVAPLMALLGERNAKAYMRAASSWHRFLPMAAAPLGILTIMTSAIRLSGPGFLVRLIGRDSERRSDALVEVTSLSVSPATSAYTPRGVEIEPYPAVDRVAFVCGHVPETTDVREAFEACKKLLTDPGLELSEDRDREAVLAVWQHTASLQDVANLVRFVENKATFNEALDLGQSCTAAISFRVTGISPTMVGHRSGLHLWTLAQMRDVFASFVFTAIMVGIQVVAWRTGGISMQTFVMGVIGYFGIVLSTMCLLIIVRNEMVAEPIELPEIFTKAYWSFSDYRHCEHKPFRGPPNNMLFSSSPRTSTQHEISVRSLFTSAVTFSIIASYVVFYLALRVAPWWTAFSVLGTIWLGAAYRASFNQNFLVATADGTGPREHWIGMFRNTGAESLLATLENSTVRNHKDSGMRTPSDSGYVIVDKQSEKKPTSTRHRHRSWKQLSSCSSFDQDIFTNVVRS